MSGKENDNKGKKEDGKKADNKKNKGTKPVEKTEDEAQDGAVGGNNSLENEPDIPAATDNIVVRPDETNMASVLDRLKLVAGDYSKDGNMVAYRAVYEIIDKLKDKPISELDDDDLHLYYVALIMSNHHQLAEAQIAQNKAKEDQMTTILRTNVALIASIKGANKRTKLIPDPKDAKHREIIYLKLNNSLYVNTSTGAPEPDPDPGHGGPRAPPAANDDGNFPTFHTIPEWLTRYSRLPNTHLDSELNTFIPSCFSMCPDPITVFLNLQREESKPAQSGIISRYVTEGLRDLSCRKAALWCLNTVLWDRAMEELGKPDYEEIKVKCLTSQHVADTSESDLIMYKDLSQQFRRNLNDLLPPNLFGRAEAPIAMELKVHRAVASDLMTMFQNMKRKRDESLGTNQQRYRMGRVNVGAAHYTAFISYFRGEAAAPMMSTTARTLGDDGIPLPDEDLEAAPYGPSGRRKGGYLLMSTALKTHIDLGMGDIEEFLNHKDPILVHAAKEVQSMTRRMNIRSEYTQQCSNIDIVFNFFLTVSAHKLAQDIPDRHHLNTVLHMIGRRMIGKAHILGFLQGAGYHDLVNSFNTTGSIHMPPYVMTPRRMYDMVSVFGILLASNLIGSMTSPSVSPRSLTHLKPSSEPAMKFLTSYYKMNGEYGAGEEEINEAEHYLHQILINKPSEYSNTIGKSGNVFALTIVAADK